MARDAELAKDVNRSDPEFARACASSEEVFARLEFPDEPGRRRNLLWRRTVIGTSAASDLRLPPDSGPGVSCVVTHDADPLRIRDVGGGVRLNDVPVRFATLCDGDTISIGPRRFVVRTNIEGHRTPQPFVGRFRVRELVGSGGMAWLFAAEDTATGERVAIKLLPSRHSERTLLQFRLEAKALLRLEHENVVHALRDVDETEVHAILFEFVEGINLAELVNQRGRVAWPVVCSLGEQAARGLHHVHSRGVVHRDVKPANLQVQKDGGVKLLDFGLVLLADDPDQSKLVELLPRKPMGTPDFIAPEQIRNSHEVDHRADLYALGGTLYHALTGSVPFPVQSPANKLRAHRRSMPRTIRRLVSDVPPEVESLVWRLLSKDPAERPSCGEEVADELRRFAQRQPVAFDAESLAHARSEIARRRAKSLESREPAGGVPAPLVLALEKGLARPA